MGPLLKGVSATLLCGAVAGALACAEAPGRAPGRGWNVLLLTLDTCRADRLGSYGHASAATPHLDALAREGALFEAAFTPVPSTLPSHSSLMTALYPARHGVHDNGIYRLEPGAVTLAERLRDAGYATAAFVSAYVLQRGFGVEQGFEHFDDRMEIPLRPFRRGEAAGGSDDRRRRWLLRLAAPYQRRADAVTARALDWLDRPRAEPFFLWVHYFDPHMPYAAPEPFERRHDPSYSGAADGTEGAFWRLLRQGRWTDRDHRHMIARYDGEIAFMDHWIGRLLQGVRDAGQWPRTVVVAVGDHGEAFGEHRAVWEHHNAVYDPVVRVPLIVRAPDPALSGVRVRGVVRTLDVAPTLLDLLELAPLPDADGRSLAPLLRDPGAESAGEILLQAVRERQILPARTSRLALRSGSHKLVLHLDPDDRIVRREFFDLERDPGEERGASAARTAMADRWESRLLERYREMARSRGPLPLRPLDVPDAEALRALGYLDGS